MREGKQKEKRSSKDVSSAESELGVLLSSWADWLIAGLLEKTPEQPRVTLIMDTHKQSRFPLSLSLWSSVTPSIHKCLYLCFLLAHTQTHTPHTQRHTTLNINIFDQGHAMPCNILKCWCTVIVTAAEVYICISHLTLHVLSSQCTSVAVFPICSI